MRIRATRHFTGVPYTRGAEPPGSIRLRCPAGATGSGDTVAKASRTPMVHACKFMESTDYTMLLMWQLKSDCTASNIK